MLCTPWPGLYKYMDKVCGGGAIQRRVYGVDCCVCMVWTVDKYVGVMRRCACSRRIASASEVGSWGDGAVYGLLVFMCFIRFCDEVGNLIYNGDMQNSKTVMTGEAVDKLCMSCG